MYIRFYGIWLSPRQVIDANTHRQLLIVATSISDVIVEADTDRLMRFQTCTTHRRAVIRYRPSLVHVGCNGIENKPREIVLESQAQFQVSTKVKADTVYKSTQCFENVGRMDNTGGAGSPHTHTSEDCRSLKVKE